MTDYEKLVSVFENSDCTFVLSKNLNSFEVISRNSIGSICYVFNAEGKLVHMYYNGGIIWNLM